MLKHRTGVVDALIAAAMFGASTPLAKPFAGEIPAFMLAGLLYLGAGIGLAAWYLLRRGSAGGAREVALARPDLPWLAAAIACGGVAAPVLMMWGLARSAAAGASLLLNLEAVFTALIAWGVFRENLDRRTALGMGAIVLGGVVLAWDPRAVAGLSIGALAVIAACLCWALDNNFTRKVSAADPVQIAALKGGVAGGVNLALALVLGDALPGVTIATAAMLLGFFGYGISLVFFVRALRYLGALRTGAFFSIAPFFGAGLALLLLGEAVDLRFWLAGGLMSVGLGIYLTERHAHEHAHEALTHSHAHAHDEHHRHAHDFPWDGDEPHTHPHVHHPLVHSHPHAPDIHHRHRH